MSNDKSLLNNNIYKNVKYQKGDVIISPVSHRAIVVGSRAWRQLAGDGLVNPVMLPKENSNSLINTQYIEGLEPPKLERQSRYIPKNPKKQFQVKQVEKQVEKTS
jgi:hypothetical protein